MSKLIEFYKQILSLGSLVADKDGLVSAMVEDMSVPFTVKGKRLALPTKENMSKTNDLCIFHPLVENFLRGESDVMQKYRSAINTRLNYVIGCLMGELLTLITSTGEHHKLNPDQNVLLSTVHQADEETLNRFMKISEVIKKSALSGEKDKGFINIYLKKTAVIKGKTYKRGAIINFPFYEELIKKEKSVYGVTLRNKDREAIQNLMEFIVPEIAVKEAYNQGSVGDISPFLDALLKGVIGVAANINEIANNYGDFLGMKESYLYNADWVDTMNNIQSLESEIRMIPMQPGNEGAVNQVNPQPQQQTLSVAPHQPQVTNTQAPVQRPNNPPQAPSSSGKMSFAELDRRARDNQQAVYQNTNQAWGVVQQQNLWQQFTPQQLSGPAMARASVSSLAMLANSAPPQAPMQQNNWNQQQFNGYI